jgi:hypothetical protein
MRKILIVFGYTLISLFVLLFITGCAAAVVGAGAGAGIGAYAYSKGELKSVEAASIDKVWKAVEKTVEEMGFVVEVKSKDALTGILEARGANDKKITIKIGFMTEKTTEVKIRVGFFGNETYSYQILKTIRSHL